MSRLSFLTKYAEDDVHYDSGKEIDTDLNDARTYVRMDAISHPNATKEHIDKALNDADWYVRGAAIEHPNVTKEHIDKALNDEDADIRLTAKYRLSKWVD